MLFQLNGGKLPLLLDSDVTFPKLFCYLKFVVITLLLCCALGLFFQFWEQKRALFHLCKIQPILSYMPLFSFSK